MYSELILYSERVNLVGTSVRTYVGGSFWPAIVSYYMEAGKDFGYFLQWKLSTFLYQSIIRSQ